MLTLSDHSHGTDPHERYVAEPHWDGTEIDEHTLYGGLTASSMVSDFTTDGSRKIAWHTGDLFVVSSCMLVSYSYTRSILKGDDGGCMMHTPRH